MKKIQILVRIEDSEVYRNYAYQEDSAEIDWNPIVNDMVDTIENVDD